MGMVQVTVAGEVADVQEFMGLACYAVDDDDGEAGRVVEVGDSAPADVIPFRAEGVFNSRHPLFYILARVRLRSELRSRGHSWASAWRLADEAADELIDGVVAAHGIGGGGEVGTAAFGDGHIIDAILRFFESPTGQAILAALLRLLLGLAA